LSPCFPGGFDALAAHRQSDPTPGAEEVVRTLDEAAFWLAICRDVIYIAFGTLRQNRAFPPCWFR
jgi:hypothetical protein